MRQRFPLAYIKGNNIWWDGYDGQETVILEEMGPKQIGAQHMKKWCDHYPFSAESKGSSVLIRPKRLLVTSNYSIEACFPEPQDTDAIKRRFKIHHYEAPFGNQ